MRKIILSQMVTLDGLFGGPNGELDWHTFDDEFAAYANTQNAATDTMLFGRKTYEGMASYWTTPDALRDDPETTRYMNSGAKVVFSRTLDKATWENTRLVKTDLVEEIKRLKAQAGKDMVIFGSGQIVSALTPHRLIDEYHMFVCPWILGRGQVLFTGIDQPVKLTLLESRQFKSGLVLLNYTPA